MRLLLAEDNRDLSQALVALLEKSGFTVDAAADGAEALAYFQNGTYDAAILDIMMPKMSGLEVLRRVRDAGDRTPVMMLTAKGTTADRIEGFDSGADDYLPKPFSAKELISRLHAILRRRQDYSPTVLEFGGLSLDYASSVVSGPEGSVALGRRELQILELLMRNPGQVFPAERLHERIWGWDSDAEVNVVWVHMSNLRKKLRETGAPASIRTVRGLGYSLVEGDA